MTPHRVREIQQLWVVALNYLDRAQALRDERRTYEQLLTSPDASVLALSADLDSAAIRLASLDDLLNGGMKAVRDRAYPKHSDSPGLREEYIHVFLRDAVAHAEPVDGVDSQTYTKRQQWLRKRTPADTLVAMGTVRSRLQRDIVNCCKSAEELRDWMKNELETWLISMKEAK